MKILAHLLTRLADALDAAGGPNELIRDARAAAQVQDLSTVAPDSECVVLVRTERPPDHGAVVWLRALFGKFGADVLFLGPNDEVRIIRLSAGYTMVVKSGSASTPMVLDLRGPRNG